MTRRYYADSVRAHQEGNLVEYSAYEKLEAQNAELRAENESLKSELTENQKYTLQLEKRVVELESQNSNLQRNVAALVEIVQNCGCEDEEPTNDG